MASNEYQRPQASILRQRLAEPVRWLNIVAGPRQVGKSTLVQSVLGEFPAASCRYVSADPGDGAAISPLLAPDESALAQTMADQPGDRVDAAWLVGQWQAARALTGRSSQPCVLAIDEVQKIPRWSEVVKGLWDQDRARNLNLHVILLGSSPLLMQKGLTESLMGRYELVRLGHWPYPEMHTAFGLSLDEYIYFGGYPGPIKAGLHRDEARWREFVKASLINPSIQKDVLALTRVDRTELLKQLFWLGCEYSGQILALKGMAENLHEKNEDEEAHTGTVAKYLGLLDQAGLVANLQKYSGSKLKQRTSSPKLLAQNNALMAVASGYDFAAAKADRSYWGRMVENAVGAHLYNSGDPAMLTYWRKGNLEVDFVLSQGKRITAIEVKSGRQRATPGLHKFVASHSGCKRLLVGEGGVSLVEFFSEPAEHWLSPP
jgi:predicted AAA+ superfamily ATPase